MKTYRIEGYKAIEMAERHGLTLCKFNDPIEDAREGLSVGEARDIAAEDPSLIYLDYAPKTYSERVTWNQEHPECVNCGDPVTTLAQPGDHFCDACLAAGINSQCDDCGELAVCRQATDPSGIVWTLCDDCNPEEGI